MMNTKKSMGSVPTRRFGLLALAWLGLSTGCPGGEDTGDTDGGSGGSVGGDPVPELPGVRLDCCYTLGVALPGSGVEYDQGCIAVESAKPCVDPSDWGNFDEELDAEEATDICAMKCPSEFPFYGPAFVGEDGLGLDIVPPYDVCTALLSSVDETAVACNPGNPTQTAPWSEGGPPSHEGSFSSGAAGSSAEVTVNGVTHAVEFTGGALIGIEDCEQRSRQEVCVLDLQSLAFELDSNPVFSGYQVDTAQLRLNMPTRTTVSFVCDSTGCSGSFDFLARTGTSLAADFAWDQTNLASGAVGGGSVALGKEQLGKISRVTGELDLDPTKSSGTIRLWGAGEDAFGGDVASVTFDLAGPVQPYSR